LKIRIGKKVLSFSQQQPYNYGKAEKPPPPWRTLAPPNSNKLPKACSSERETDAPFEVINWQTQGELTPVKLLQLTNHPPDAPVEVASVDDLFAIVTQEEDWHDEEERETVKRFQNKVSVLKQNLSQLQVYRVGNTNINAYIVGVTPSGD